MEKAVKLALVDPKHLEYRELQKAPEGQVRAGLSMDMRSILADPGLPDDLKVKLYRQAADRFMNVSDKVEDRPLPPINYVPPPPAKPPFTPVKRRSRRKRKQQRPWSPY